MSLKSERYNNYGTDINAIVKQFLECFVEKKTRIYLIHCSFNSTYLRYYINLLTSHAPPVKGFI